MKVNAVGNLKVVPGGLMYNKILVPLDGSPVSQCILPHLRQLALGTDRPAVTILRVVEPLPDDVRNALVELEGELIIALEKKRQAGASTYVNGIVRGLCEQGGHVDGLVLTGKPAEAIINYAQKNQVDLILLSTHGRSAAVLWPMGSVAYKVSTRSPLPVQLISVQECVTRGGC
jgi:nucleotide-binding universal stress UspA family protein